MLQIILKVILSRNFLRHIFNIYLLHKILVEHCQALIRKLSDPHMTLARPSPEYVHKTSQELTGVARGLLT